MVDKHVVKMPLEHAQMLSTAVRMSGIDAGYKITHKNHPCSIWVRESVANFLYLIELTFSINEEWKERYDHTHDMKAWEVIKSLPVPNLPDIPMTPFAQAMPDEYKNPDAVEAYRAYYNGAKQHIASWKHQETPPWFKIRP
jgi:hypothetical protein